MLEKKRGETVLKKLPIRPLISIATIAMASPAVLAQAQTEPTNALQLRASVGYEHDSNVLRVPPGAGPISDSVLQYGVGLKFDKKYGLQRLHADIEANDYRYQDQSDLNYTTINYGLGWDWSITPRFHGVLSADRKQYREVTTDPITGGNLVGRRTERTELAEGVYEVGAAWRALGGFSHTRATSTQPLSWDASPDIRTAFVGVGYEFPSGTSITGRFRRGNGEYTDVSFGPVARNFKDTEADVTLKWPVTAKTSVEARVGHLKREHDVPQLDFSGMVGNATVAWEITGKTRLVAGYIRDLSGSGLATGGHVSSNRFYIAPVWQATGKTSFSVRYDHTTRDWRDVPVASFNFDRNETIRTASLGMDWEALRWLTVSPYVRSERLTSSVSGGYRATIYGVVAKANF
jgi:exopolysaccharide biosynthesis operon protein EpsL